MKLNGVHFACLLAVLTLGLYAMSFAATLSNIFSITPQAFPEVTIKFAMSDLNRTAVNPFQLSDFSVVEEGRPCQVMSVSNPQCFKEATDVSLAIVIDRSGSMSGVMDDVKQAAKNFLYQFDPNSIRVALISFESTVYIDANFSADFNSVIFAIDTIQAGGGTAVWDGVEQGLDLLKSETSAQRAVIALTDGGDNSSQTTLNGVKAYAVNLRIPVFTIGLGGGVNTAELQDLATASGGDFYLAPTIADLGLIYDSIANTFQGYIQLQYLSQRPVPDQQTRPVTLSFLGGAQRTSFYEAHPACVLFDNEDAPLSLETVTTGNPRYIPFRNNLVDGTPTIFEAYLNLESATQSVVQLALYRERQGKPDRLLATANLPQTIACKGWHQFSFDQGLSAIQLQRGEQLWMEVSVIGGDPVDLLVSDATNLPHVKIFSCLSSPPTVTPTPTKTPTPRYTPIQTPIPPESRQWRQVDAVGAIPGARSGHVLVQFKDEVLLFGGRNGNQVFFDSWLFDGGDWTQLTGVGSPGPRWNAAAAYDVAREVVVLFGGAKTLNPTTGDISAETWEFDGTSWQMATPSGAPAQRWRAAMCEDPAGGVVMFGGESAPGMLGATTEEVWNWDGTSWTAYTPRNGPGRGLFYHAAYDRERDVAAVSVEGLDTFEYWDWDGGWDLRFYGLAPESRAGQAVAFLDEFDSTILFGGYRFPEGAFRSSLGDTYMWNGQVLSEMNQGLGPKYRFHHAMAEMPLEQTVILFGGQTADGTYQNDLWKYGEFLNATPTPGPLNRPHIMLAGYWDTMLQERMGSGTWNLYAITDDTSIPHIEVFFQGSSLNLRLPPEQPGVYFLSLPLSGLFPAQFLFEFSGVNANGTAATWPQLVVN